MERGAISQRTTLTLKIYMLSCAVILILGLPFLNNQPRRKGTCQMSYLVGGIKMKFPIIVGAGACKTPESVTPYMERPIILGGIVTGSYTPDARSGNDGILFYPDELQKFLELQWGLNAFGMPNMGYSQAVRELSGRFPWPRYPLIANIAGFSVNDYVRGLRIFQLTAVEGIELNFGCPNAHDHKTVPIAYDITSLIQILEAFKKEVIRCPIWIKLSPYITMETLESLSRKWPELDFSNVPTVTDGFLSAVLHIIMTYRQFVRAVVFSNTLPNVIFRDNTGKPVTSPNDGKAGLSGAIIKPLALKLVKQARKILPKTIDVIGCGGILTGDDAIDYFQAGAAGIQCTSGPFWYGKGSLFFTNLVSESPRLQEYLTHQNNH